MITTGFQSSGANFLNFANIQMQSDESHVDLFQRLTSFVEDNLLSSNCGISHHGEPISEDEEVTPTMKNLIVLTWLQLIAKICR